MAGDRIQNFVNNAADEPAAEESVSSKLWRETQLVGTGLLGVHEGAQQALEDPLGTTARAGVAFGIGMLASRYGAAESVGAQLLKTGSAAAGLAFLVDVGAKGQRVSEAMVDTWRNDANWNKNAATMKQDLGRFAFDTALMTGSGMAGGKFGSTLRPTNSPFHEDFIRSRTDANIVGKDGAKSLAWDVSSKTGLHNPLYTPKQLGAIHADTGLPLPALEVINTATEGTLANSSNLLHSLNIRGVTPLRLRTQIAADPILGQGKIAGIDPVNDGHFADVLAMTRHLRAHGSLGDYYHTTPGVWKVSRQTPGTRAVPRHYLEP